MDYITKKIEICLSDIIGLSLEEFLDFISEKAVGSDLLMDISYKAVGVVNYKEGNTIVLEVTGDPTAINEMKEES